PGGPVQARPSTERGARGQLPSSARGNSCLSHGAKLMARREPTRLRSILPRICRGKSARVALWMAVFALSPTAAFADLLADRAQGLLLWVAHRTGYSAENVKLTVILVEPKAINVVVYG